MKFLFTTPHMQVGGFLFKECLVVVVLADFLKVKRESCGLTQIEVAKKLGYSSPQFVSNWERSLSTPPMNKLKKIAELYNVSADEIFDVLLNETLRKVEEDLTRKFYGRVKRSSSQLQTKV